MRHHRFEHAVVSATLGALLVLLGASDANACSCETGIPIFSLPRPEQENVPTNTRLWGPAASGAPLVDTDGVEVPVRVTRLRVGMHEVAVATPVQELKPNTRYAVQDSQRMLEFTTGAGPLNTPPSVPSVQSHFSINVPLLCPGAPPVPVRAVIFDVETDGLLVVVDADATARLDEVAVDGELPWLVPASMGITLGFGGCISNWPRAAVAPAVTVAFGAYDIAGNFSGWSPPLVRPFAVLGVCACVQAPNGWPPALGLVLLAGARLAARGRRALHG